MKVNKLIINIYFQFSILVLYPIETAGQTNIGVYIQPSVINVGLPETFDLNINIGPVQDLYSFATDISYNSSIIEIVEIIDGDFLSEGGSVNTLFLDDIDNQIGQCIIGLSRSTSPSSGTSSQQDTNIVTLRFQTVSSGTSSVTLSNTGLIAPDGDTEYPINVTNGVVNIVLPSDTAIIQFDPSVYNVNQYDTINTAVTIDNISNLFAIAADLNFDTTFIEILSISEGHFLNENGSEQTSFIYDINNENETVIIGLSRLDNSILGMNTTNPETLFTIIGVAKKPGAMNFRLSNLGLLSPDGQSTYEYVSNIGSISIAPFRFNLLSPSKGDTTYLTTPTLNWENIISPVQNDDITYTIHYSTDSTFALYDSVTNIQTNYYTFTSDDSLSDDTKYFWKVFGNSQKGMMAESIQLDWFFSILYNNPPSFLTTELADAYEGAVYSDTVIAADPDIGDIFNFFSFSLPNWMTLDTTNGALSGIPSNSDVINSIPVIIGVRDAGGLVDTLNTTIAVSDTISPAVPTNLTASAGNTQVILKWSQNSESDFAKYIIYGGASTNPTSKIDSTTIVIDTTKTMTGLTNGTTYYYRIIAIDNTGNESGYSSEVKATPNLIADNLVAYYPFSGNANDESGNGNNGTENGGVTLTTDRFGNANTAYSFDGVDDWIDIPDWDWDTNNNYSVTAWIKSTDSDYETSGYQVGAPILGDISGTVQGEIGLDSGKIAYNWYQGGNYWYEITGTTIISDGNWHFLSWINHNNSTIDFDCRWHFRNSWRSKWAGKFGKLFCCSKYWERI